MIKMAKSEKNNGSDMIVSGKKLYVKYMVSLRCKIVVKGELKKMGIKHTISPQGAIEFFDEISQSQFDELKKNLQRLGLELLNENNSRLVDRIINLIIEEIHYSDELPKLSFADFISKNIDSGHEAVLKIFSDVKGISVIQFMIIQKIERIKELLLYEDLTLAEISEKLNYRNEQFMTSQFKKYTGLTPTYFRQLKKERMSISVQGSKAATSGYSG